MPANSDINFNKIRTRRTRESAQKVKEDCTYGNKTPLNARGIVEAIVALRTHQGLIDNGHRNCAGLGSALEVRVLLFGNGEFDLQLRQMRPE